MILEISHRLEPLDDGVYRVMAWTSEADGISPEVFAHQVLPDTEGQPPSTSRFSHVASVADMLNLPDIPPVDGSTMWRRRFVDMLVAGKGDADGLLDGLKGDLEALAARWKAVCP
jgi:hypothetical protein